MPLKVRLSKKYDFFSRSFRNTPPKFRFLLSFDIFTQFENVLISTSKLFPHNLCLTSVDTSKLINFRLRQLKLLKIKETH